MEKMHPRERLLRFGVFEIDLLTGELRKDGRKIKLQEQPFQVLAMLLEQPGEIITREELHHRLWSSDTFVDFDNSLNIAINKIRQALGDSADNPRFVETMARRGYRFIAPVDGLNRGLHSGKGELEQVPPGDNPERSQIRLQADVPSDASASRSLEQGLSRRKYLGVAMGTGLLLVIGILAAIWWNSRMSTKPSLGPVLIRLTNDSGLSTDPALSPDGKLLAYASDRGGDGNLDIWVKQIGGGEPLRLTRHEADDFGPAFSPDGSLIAFQRYDGGIYTIPALGGEERQIAKYGEGPRFSPDGKWIAFFTDDPEVKIYVIPSVGGLPKQVASDFEIAFAPIWAPNGNYFLFLGSRGAGTTARPETTEDWWVVSLDGKTVVRTGAYGLFNQYGLSVQGSFNYGHVIARDWTSDGKHVVFSAKVGDSTSIWQVPISSRTWQVAGPPRQLTFGTGQEDQPSAAMGGRLAFSSVMSNDDIWTLPLNANRGRVVGDPQRLTENVSEDRVYDLSADGRKLLFLSDRTGKRQVWVRDLVTAKESQITRTDAAVEGARITADGSEIAYMLSESQKPVIYVVPIVGGVAEKVCEDCGGPWHWSPQGRSFLYRIPDRAQSVGLFDLATGKKTELLKHPRYGLTGPQFSPDSQWISVFVEVGPGRTRLFIVPFRKGLPPNENEWIAVTDGSDSAYSSQWSPDGNLLYFLSNRDAFWCYWAQRLDPATKHPRGSAFPVYHSHRSRQPLSFFAIAQDKMVFTQGELSGNIWMTTIEK